MIPLYHVAFLTLANNDICLVWSQLYYYGLVGRQILNLMLIREGLPAIYILPNQRTIYLNALQETDFFNYRNIVEFVIKRMFISMIHLLSLSSILSLWKSWIRKAIRRHYNYRFELKLKTSGWAGNDGMCVLSFAHVTKRILSFRLGCSTPASYLFAADLSHLSFPWHNHGSLKEEHF